MATSRCRSLLFIHPVLTQRIIKNITIEHECSEITFGIRLPYPPRVFRALKILKGHQLHHHELILQTHKYTPHSFVADRSTTRGRGGSWIDNQTTIRCRTGCAVRCQIVPRPWARPSQHQQQQQTRWTLSPRGMNR